MNPEAQRIAIAEACGWADIKPHSWHPRKGELWGGWKGIRYMIPDYLNELNAMHEAERTMGDPQLWVEYQSYLSDVMGHVGWLYHATASQRAEAFLKTLNLWTP